MHVRRLEDLEAWNTARALAKDIHALPQSHPVKRDFGFRDQLCRCSVSTMSNIAEAWGRHSDPDKARFLDFARGPGYESLSMLTLGHDIGYLSPEEYEHFERLNRKALGQITSLLKYLRRESKARPPTSDLMAS